MPSKYNSQILSKGYILLAASLTFMALFGISCKKDDFNTTLLEQPVWEPEVAFPLVYTELGISDLVNVNDSNTTIVTDPDQFCTLIYQGRAFELNAWQLVSLQDQTFQKDYSLNYGQILTLGNSGQVHVSKIQNIDFNFSQGIEIDTMLLKEGTLELTLNSDFPLNGSVQIQIPGMTKNGLPFSATLPLNYTGNIPVSISQSISLTDYRMDYTQGSNGHNQLSINYMITLTGGSAGVTTTNSIICKTEFQSTKFAVLYGYLGQQSISNIQDSIELSIFNNVIGSGSFNIADPSVRFDISNSLGIPMQARLNQLTAINGNMTNFVVASGIPDPLPVTSPTISQIGQIIQGNFTLNKDNSNILAMITQQPKYLISQSQLITNPSGRNINFLTDTSKIAMDIHVELPFYGNAENFRITDTVPFSYNDLANVENLTLRMDITNGFPIESSVQLVFVDEMMNALDTIFIPGEVVIPSGIVDPVTERVISPGNKIHNIVLNQSTISKILNASHLIVLSSATTFNNGNTNVKIYNDYRLKLKIGAIAKMKIH